MTPEGHCDHMWDALRSEDRSVSDGNSGHVTKPSLELDRCRVEGDQIPVAGTVNKIILMAGLEQQECTTLNFTVTTINPNGGEGLFGGKYVFGLFLTGSDNSLVEHGSSPQDDDALIVSPLAPTDRKV